MDFTKTRASVTLLSMMACLFFSITAVAAEIKTEPFKLLNAEEFKAVMDEAPSGLVVLDARPAGRYLDGHIKGARNIFAPDLEKDPSLLKAPKDSKMLVYCDGVKCDKKTGKTPSGLPCRSIEAILLTKSGKAAKTVVEQGYRDVSVLYEGFPGWDLKGYDAYGGQGDDKRLELVRLGSKELKTLVKSKSAADAVFVDLRNPGEYAKGHIPGAVNIPFATFEINGGRLDKGKRIVVYCDTGERSHIAYRRLQKLNYPNIAMSTYGAWKSTGLPDQK